MNGEISAKEFLKMYETSYVFNVDRRKLRDLKVPVNYIDAGEMGEIQQRVDFFGFIDSLEGENGLGTFSVLPDGEICVDLSKHVVMDSFFKEVTDSGGGYFDVGSIVEDFMDRVVKLKGIMVVTRTKSSYIGDKKGYGVTYERYNFCNREIGDLLEAFPSVGGMVAADRRIINSVGELKEYLGDMVKEGKMTKGSYNKFMREYERVMMGE